MTLYTTHHPMPSKNGSKIISNHISKLTSWAMLHGSLVNNIYGTLTKKIKSLVISLNKQWSKVCWKSIIIHTINQKSEGNFFTIQTTLIQNHNYL